LIKNNERYYHQQHHQEVEEYSSPLLPATKEACSSLRPSSIMMDEESTPDRATGASSSLILTPIVPQKKQGSRTTSYPNEKLILARQIVETIKSRGGRFLERVPAGGTTTSSYTCSYCEVEDSVAIEKTKHSFRHQLRALEQEDDRVLKDTAWSSPPKRKVAEVEDMVQGARRHGASKYQRAAAAAASEMKRSTIGTTFPSTPLPLAHRSLSNSERTTMMALGGVNQHQLGTSLIGIQAPLLLPTLEHHVATSLLSRGREYCSLGPVGAAGLLSCYPPPRTTKHFSGGSAFIPPSSSTAGILWNAQHQRAKEEKVFMRRRQVSSIIQANRNAQLAADLSLLLTLQQQQQQQQHQNMPY
jgi:hypothetical protein